MSAIGHVDNYDLRRALEIERMILANLPRTVGPEHPAYQSTQNRIEVLRRLCATALRVDPSEV